MMSFLIERARRELLHPWPRGYESFLPTLELAKESPSRAASQGIVGVAAHSAVIRLSSRPTPSGRSHPNPAQPRV